jgi:hypothetical protein
MPPPLLLLLLEAPELLEPPRVPLDEPLDPLEPPELLPLRTSEPPSVPVPGFAGDVSSPHASHAPAEPIVSAPIKPIPRRLFLMGLPYSGAVADATVNWLEIYGAVARSSIRNNRLSTTQFGMQYGRAPLFIIPIVDGTAQASTETV